MSEPDDNDLDAFLRGASSGAQTMVRIVVIWVASIGIIAQTVGRLEAAAGQPPWIALGLVNLVLIGLLIAADRNRI